MARRYQHFSEKGGGKRSYISRTEKEGRSFFSWGKKGRDGKSCNLFTIMRVLTGKGKFATEETGMPL